MFLGEYDHSIDDKGRLTIPSRFRDALDAGAVVTRGYEGYLVLYPLSVFEQIAAKVMRLSPTDPENRLLSRLVFSGAFDGQLDRTGRFNIPRKLLDYAGIADDAVIVGAGQHVEIWSPEGWQQQLAQVNDIALNAARFTELDLSPEPALEDDDDTDSG